MSRQSLSIRSVSRSTLRWWLIVGPDKSTPLSLHTQASPPSDTTSTREDSARPSRTPIYATATAAVHIGAQSSCCGVDTSGAVDEVRPGTDSMASFATQPTETRCRRRRSMPAWGAATRWPWRSCRRARPCWTSGPETVSACCSPLAGWPGGKGLRAVPDQRNAHSCPCQRRASPVRPTSSSCMASRLSHCRTASST